MHHIAKANKGYLISSHLTILDQFMLKKKKKLFPRPSARNLKLFHLSGALL